MTQRTWLIDRNLPLMTFLVALAVNLLFAAERVNIADRELANLRNRQRLLLTDRLLPTGRRLTSNRRALEDTISSRRRRALGSSVERERRRQKRQQRDQAGPPSRRRRELNDTISSRRRRALENVSGMNFGRRRRLQLV